MQSPPPRVVASHGRATFIDLTGSDDDLDRSHLVARRRPSALAGEEGGAARPSRRRPRGEPGEPGDEAPPAARARRTVIDLTEDTGQALDATLPASPLVIDADDPAYALDALEVVGHRAAPPAPYVPLRPPELRPGWSPDRVRHEWRRLLNRSPPADLTAEPPPDMPLYALFGSHLFGRAQPPPPPPPSARAQHVMRHLPQLPRARPVGRVKRVRVARVERQPVVDGVTTCPICLAEMRAPAPRLAKEERTVWCQFGCGASVHAQCFDEWRRARAFKHEAVSCVLCRQDWKGFKAVEEP